MLDSFLAETAFLPHGFCLLWKPQLVALHLGSDIAIGLAYFSIPIAILDFLRRKPHFEHRWIAGLFAAFIILCGITHFVGAATLWIPAYTMDGLVKAATAVVSMVTAATLWTMMPRVLAIPSPRELAEANRRLAAEILERRAAEAELGRARDELELRVQERTAALDRSEQRLRLATQAARIGTWDWDVAADRIVWSPEGRAILGTVDADPAGDTGTAEESMDLADFVTTRVHPADRARVAQELELASVRGHWIGEFRIIRADGELRWVEVRGSVVTEERAGPSSGPGALGAPRSCRLIGTLVDGTERVIAARALEASLAEKETLLREIHHRVKNNLQSLLSLLQLERRRLDDRDMAARFDAMRARVQVMANIHEGLYGSETLSFVDMGDQLRSLCDGIGALIPIPEAVAIEADADDVCCSLEIAVPLGVLANELILNAAKHAFPDGRRGRIQVSLRMAESSVRLTVADDGVGDPQLHDPGRSGATCATGDGAGIGKRLTLALARQLGASLETTTGLGATAGGMTGAGTTVTVTIPAHNFFARHAANGVPGGSVDGALQIHPATHEAAPCAS